MSWRSSGVPLGKSPGDKHCRILARLQKRNFAAVLVVEFPELLLRIATTE
jgi:hypothetical protein